ncbi:MAG: S8 family serine peptidase [Methylotenera sp.]|nr:S8 family serine peptidase [Oligoflexia bacterium]
MTLFSSGFSAPQAQLALPFSRSSGISIAVLIALSFSLVSCAKPESSQSFPPVMAKVGSVVMGLSKAESVEICKTAFCETNHVYQASFGRSRRKDPVPPPAPVPEPTHSGPTTYDLSGQEVLDYSRDIMHVPDAWKITKGSSDVIVAVIDSGVTIGHPDLQENIYVNQAELNGRPGVDDDGNGYVDDVYGWDFVNQRPNGIDDNGHGTHCAGIIGAGANGKGIVGVTQKVRIMPLKFLNADGSGDTVGAIQAIDYAVANGARVISNSWGGGGYSSLLDQAIQRAVSRGVLVVAAAGNSSMDNDTSASFPANYSGVISVGSSDNQDNRSFFSNYGKSSVMVIAPGSNILSTWLENRWAYLSGTSMATPQVSGALALALAAKPSASADELKSALCNSSAKILMSSSRCGRMDVAQLIRTVAQ